MAEDATVKGTTSEATLAALLASENGALTDRAIRDQVGSMRAVPWLVKRGLVRVAVGEAWIENDRGGMDLVPDVVTVRLAHCAGCGRELPRWADWCCG